MSLVGFGKLARLLPAPTGKQAGIHDRRLCDQPPKFCITWIPAGPRMTTNKTGRKNKIIGTVSFGGNAAAFFSASDMRMSGFPARERATPR